MTKVAVVILNYNGVEYLQKFLPVVVANSSGADIWVADNASSDESLGWIKSNFPSVKLIEMTENTGFAGGYNAALQQIKTGYYVLLNSDVEVTPNWIEPVIELMEADQTIAACQPKIKSYAEQEKFEYAGAAGGFIDKYGYPFCRGRIFNNTEVDTKQHDEPIEVFWATGACLFVRSELFHSVGEFDADYFAHMEEIDLCWRLKNKGYKIMCQPKSEVYHVGGGTLNKSNPHKTYLNFRNSLYTLAKNHPEKGLFGKLLTRLVLDGVAGVKFMFEGDVGDMIAVIKAHWSFFRNYRNCIEKRKGNEVEQTKIYASSIVFSHFLKGIKQFNNLPDKWS